MGWLPSFGWDFKSHRMLNMKELGAHSSVQHIRAVSVPTVPKTSTFSGGCTRCSRGPGRGVSSGKKRQHHMRKCQCSQSMLPSHSGCRCCPASSHASTACTAAWPPERRRKTKSRWDGGHFRPRPAGCQCHGAKDMGGTKGSPGNCPSVAPVPLNSCPIHGPQAMDPACKFSWAMPGQLWW